jgi:hypothetical protein
MTESWNRARMMNRLIEELCGMDEIARKDFINSLKKGEMYRHAQLIVKQQNTCIIDYTITEYKINGYKCIQVFYLHQL